jgi:hypothetical protein
MIRAGLGSMALLVVAALSGCGHKESAAPAPAVSVETEATVDGDIGADPLVEQHDDGSVAWRIDPDGKVRAVASTTAGVPIKQDLGGTLVYKLDGEPRTVPLVMDARTGVLTAAGPKLEADLTEVDYTITVAGKPWSGVMHVPAGGTAALVANASVTAEAKLPEQTVGPHGGTIQIVGDDRLEMVAEGDSGRTRVFVLDANLQPVTLEARTLRMGFIAERSELVTFVPEPSGLFFVGRIGHAFNPLQVTVALGFGGVTRAAIWGYHPGVRLYAPSATVLIATAPRLQFRLKGGFDSDVDVYGRSHVNVVVKGNNGRHVGEDGTWARDSDGFKSDDDHGGHGDHGDHGGGHVRVDVGGGDHGGGDHGGHDVRGPSGNGGPGPAKGGGGGKSGGGKGGGKGGKH